MKLPIVLMMVVIPRLTFRWVGFELFLWGWFIRGVFNLMVGKKNALPWTMVWLTFCGIDNSRTLVEFKNSFGKVFAFYWRFALAFTFLFVWITKWFQVD